MRWPFSRNLSVFSKLFLFTFILFVIVVFTAISFSLHERKITDRVSVLSEKDAVVKTPTIPTLTPMPTLAFNPTPTITPAIRKTETKNNTYFNFDILFGGALSSVEKEIAVDVFTDRDILILRGSGVVKLASESGSFVGSIDMGDTLSDGSYMIRIGAKKYLQKVLPRAALIQAGDINIFRQISMTAGDINGDNAIDILDFNLLIGCYSGQGLIANCEDSSSIDLTEDGVVDNYDYDLFLEGIGEF